MGFYVSHSDLLLLIDKGILAEKKQAIRKVVGDDADGFDETELPGGLTALTPIPEMSRAGSEAARPLGKRRANASTSRWSATPNGSAAKPTPSC